MGLAADFLNVLFGGSAEPSVQDLEHCFRVTDLDGSFLTNNFYLAFSYEKMFYVWVSFYFYFIGFQRTNVAGCFYLCRYLGTLHLVAFKMS